MSSVYLWTYFFKDLYLDHISVEKNASSNTPEAYARDLDKCIVFLMEQEKLQGPREVRLIHLARFFQSLSKAGLAASSQARAQSAVRQLFKWGAKRGHVEADPSRGLQPKKGASPPTNRTEPRAGSRLD